MTSRFHTCHASLKALSAPALLLSFSVLFLHSRHPNLKDTRTCAPSLTSRSVCPVFFVCSYFFSVRTVQSPLPSMSHGWGAQDASGSGWGSAQEPHTKSFDTADMANALRDTNGNSEPVDGSASNAVDGQSAQAAPGGTAANGEGVDGWTPSLKYDYDQFADARGGDFDGNKRVYHWDGEEGDLGPEFPELEEELFGPADKRELPTGIDFSR